MTGKMVINFGLIFLLASSVLFAIAAVVYFHSSSLSLPISPAVTIITALLPIASLFNAFIYPSVLQAAHSSVANRLQQLSPTILQAVQAIATTVLATLLFQDVVPSPTIECLLGNGWAGMFQGHDAESIRRIQDTLNCCGFKTLKDRAYPFSSKEPLTCAKTYGRTVACEGPWRSALQSSAGVDFGVVIAVGLMQIFGLLMMRESPNWWTSWRSTGRRYRVNAHENRPLLTAAAGEEEEVVERQEPPPRGYQALNDRDDPGPRVEPSTIGHERNAWSEN